MGVAFATPIFRVSKNPQTVKTRLYKKRLPFRGRVALRCRWQMKQGVSECRGLCATQAFAPRRTQGTANGCCQRKLTEGFNAPSLKKLATQDILTYCTTRTLPYHLYADGFELFVFGAPLTSASLSKKYIF